MIAHFQGALTVPSSSRQIGRRLLRRISAPAEFMVLSHGGTSRSRNPLGRRMFRIATIGRNIVIVCAQGAELVSVLFAFLHHLAAFTLVAAVALEFVLSCRSGPRGGCRSPT